MASRDLRKVRKRNRVATLHAVAAEAGVSTATVSRALNGLPVSPENIARVQAAVKTLGYVPNEAARTIRGGRTMTIGIVLHAEIHPNFELMSIVNRLIVEMEQHGYSVFLSVVPGGSEVETYLRRFAERRVDGLFYWTAAWVPSLDAYSRAGIPVIAIGYRDELCADLPLITVDAAPVYRKVYRQLKAWGHRSSCEIAPNQVSAVHEAVAAECGLSWNSSVVGFDSNSIVEFARSLQAPNAPTVVFANFPVAVQLLTACDQVGLRVPDDLSIIGTTDSEFATVLRTPLSALRTDYDAFNAAAAATMLEALAGRPIKDVDVCDALVWVERETTGPAPKRTRKP